MKAWARPFERMFTMAVRCRFNAWSRKVHIALACLGMLGCSACSTETVPLDGEACAP